ncbi:hypothetical protein MRB53_009417 [Persea americana]|uniref:Uncharacterized protein n=1 Tax=Persea americana TaxID=3435 RepID=A0ACC2LPB7_PERAE|nr:hypothetical protein MRB53_009417 [Persea americana]|eukprot:TRINITY_DN34814_c0_g1_i2.p1 TRINITY_DN34814_c0_g1~~TRINITY_DN34814_c0_g1_i2.p1  ORF type:complete len:343 (+),score=83.92 TRINITY_DN34814_c0_g1_i2:366-1394(+)
MSEALVARYWCHMCSQMVSPIMEAEIKCPFCESGFVEEMDGRRDDDIDLGSDRAFSLWAPILLGLMGGPSRRRRLRRGEEEEENQGESEQEREPREGRDPESIIRRRRRNSAAMLQLLRGLRSSELDTSESERGDRERVILINPFNRAVILEGSFDSNETQDESRNTPGSLGDYFIGPGLDLLLQHLAENDPSRYGTPPAKKEAIEAMPTVKISENLECTVCLDDFSIGSEAKEMPCKHKFHSGCIMPWLELHSSCPVCRFQLPSDGSKVDVNVSDNSNTNTVDSGSSSSEERGSEGGDGNGRSFWVSVPWPFNGLFSSSGSQGGGNSSSSASGSDFPSDEN